MVLSKPTAKQYALQVYTGSLVTFVIAHLQYTLDGVRLTLKKHGWACLEDLSSSLTEEGRRNHTLNVGDTICGLGTRAT